MGKLRHRILVAVLLPLALSVAPPAAAESIRIMPFGDDWTAGAYGHASYRYPLWFMLQDAGFDVDFVGFRSGTLDAPNPEWYPAYNTTFDRDHEGRDRTTTAMISPADSRAETFRPHVVLLMVGGRDIYELGAGGIALTTNNVPQIIQGFRNHVPDVVILLAKPPPWINTPSGSTNGTEFVAPLADAIGELAQAQDTPESPVYLIDNFTGFNTDTMLDQGAVPNLLGEQWMAENFYEVLEDVLPAIDTDGESGFAINAGLNDAWFNPDTPGQGFFVSVFPDISSIFLAWFTYDTERPSGDVDANLGEPGHRWLTAFGEYAGDTAVLDIELTRGGIFDSAEPPVEQSTDGSIMLECTGCNECTVTYDITSADVQGVIPIERIALDNVPGCETLAGSE
jgi:acyl-CoA thioesterase-1